MPSNQKHYSKVILRAYSDLKTKPVWFRVKRYIKNPQKKVFTLWKFSLLLSKDDAPVPVPPEINNLVDKVKNNIKLDQGRKHLIIPFMIQSLDLKHLGFSNAKTKSFLGIPLYFAFKDRNDANFFTLVKNNFISKHTVEVQTLIDTMYLSEGAKEFGIAHELYELIYSQTQLISALPVFTVSICNVISYLVEKFSRNPHRTSYGVHIFIYLLGATAYFFILNLTIAYKETKADFLTSELGKFYIQSGIEYYDKKMKRNKILKKLTSNAPYTEDGDIPISVLKPFRVPLSRRITYLRDLDKAKKKKPSVWSYILYSY